MPVVITRISAIAELLALQLYAIFQNSICKTFRVGMFDFSENILPIRLTVFKRLIMICQYPIIAQHFDSSHPAAPATIIYP